MGLFTGSKNENSGEAVGVALMLGEIRDLRGTIDKHDERLRGEIGGVKQSVSDLSQAVLRSQGDVGAIRTDIDRMSDNFDSMQKDLTGVQSEVNELKNARDIDDAGWVGPKKLARSVILVGSFLAAVAILVKFGPGIWAAFI